MLLNEILGVKAKDLKSLTWKDLVEIIEDADGDRPANKDNVNVRFMKSSLPIKKGQWEGWGFIYELSYEDINDEQVKDEYVVWVNKEGKLDIRAVSA